MVRTSRAGRARSMLLVSAVAAVALGLCSFTFAELEQPKRNMSAYLLWLKANRAKIVATLPEGSNLGPDVMKAAGVEWNKLAAKSKKPFEDEAAAAKAEYQKAMEKFLADGGVVEKKTKKTKKTKKAKKAKDPNAPKRPLSAYFLWLQENRAAIAKTLPAGSNLGLDVAKAAGKEWTTVSEKSKKKYQDQAAELRAKYEKEMEAYRAA